MIHPTAIIDPTAAINSDVEIGPYVVVEADVTIGAGTTIGSHAIIGPHAAIEPDCRIFPGAAIGGDPQSVKFEGEETHVRIGRRTIIREYATINRGTGFGGGITQVGEDCYLMAYAHVGHDCTVGNHAILVNSATLAGHVTVGDHASVGAFSPVQQFVRIGDYAYIGGSSAVNVDVPPYVMAVGFRAKLTGLNSVGLRRQGFTSETLSQLKKAYRIIFRSKLRLKDAVAQVTKDIDQIPEVVNLVAFLQSAERGFTR